MLLLLGALLCPLAALSAQASPPMGATQPPAWSAELRAALAELPVMDGGRVKPLLAHAGVQMLQLSNKRTLTLEDGKTRLDPIQWWLTTTLYPEVAQHFKIFKVTDIAAVEQIGVSAAGHKKRDSFSYAELLPGIPRLFQQANEIQKIPVKERTRLQKQTWDLAGRVSLYDRLHHLFEWAREDYSLGGSAALEARFGGASTARFSDVVEQAGELLTWFERLDAEAANATEPNPDRQALGNLLREVSQAAQIRYSFDVLPQDRPAPPEDAEPEVLHDWEVWHDPMDAAFVALQGRQLTERELGVLRALEAMARAGDDSARLAAVERAEELVAGIAEGRGRDELRNVALEVDYHSWNLHWHSIYMFLLGFVLGLVALLSNVGGWAKASLICRVGSFATVTGALGMLVVAITMRCLIRERPPISNLYETILFIGAVGVLAALVMEWFYRKGFAVTVAGAAGALAVIGAHRFELNNANDTMDPLVAVLDDNFWLATHVTTINIGYAAGMLAAIIGGIALVGMCGVRLLHPNREPQGFKAFYKTATSMVYGVTCFGVLFGTVGTILGGVWANDSWGRFWGWDPKENGALMIVLAQLFLLHGRMGGHLRQFGQCLVATLTGWVVIFSWFHVNQLGVGLHAYGFSESLQTAIFLGYWAFGIMAGIGVLGYIVESGVRRAAAVGSGSESAQSEA